jgi:hypothetical protein
MDEHDAKATTTTLVAQIATVRNGDSDLISLSGSLCAWQGIAPETRRGSPSMDASGDELRLLRF